MNYEAGKRYSINVNVTNYSKQGVNNIPATLNTQVSLYTDYGTILAPMFRSDAFYPQQTKTFTYTFDVPAGYGGASGQILAQVMDNYNNRIKQAIQYVSISTPPPPVDDHDSDDNGVIDIYDPTPEPVPPAPDPHDSDGDGILDIYEPTDYWDYW